jgi:hypothetical protein
LEVPITFAPYIDFVNWPNSEDRKIAWEALYNNGMATFVVSPACGNVAGLNWDTQLDYP